MKIFRDSTAYIIADLMEIQERLCELRCYENRTENYQADRFIHDAIEALVFKMPWTRILGQNEEHRKSLTK